MSAKKSIILGSLIWILLAVAILASCGGDYMRSAKSLLQFSELIEQGKLNDISLTIYFMNPFTSTRRPLSIDDLINFNSVNKIAINGNLLEEHINLFNKVSDAALISVEKVSYLNARIYYVFETEKKGKIFDVAMWGGYDDNSIFVNGLEVKENDIFYDLIMPFLPKDAVKELEEYLGRNFDSEAF